MKTYKQLTEKCSCTDTQLLRMAIIEEMDAIVKYEKFAMKATDSRVKELFLDIAREEKVHAEEFEEILEMIDPDMEEVDDEAEEEEVENMFDDDSKEYDY